MKRTVMDERTLREFKRLTAMVQSQGGVPSNVDKVVEVRDERALRVWEKTFREKGEGRRG